MIKRYIEILPSQREALFKEVTDRIKIRPAKSKTSKNEYVVYSSLDYESVRRDIESIVNRFNVG